MKGRLVGLALLLLAFAFSDPARGQDTARGRAFGTTLDVGGTNVITQGDTGTKTAPNPANTPNPNAFDATASAATVPAAPLAEVVTGPSRTRGCSNSSGCPNLFPTPAPTGALPASLANKQFVLSEGGSSTTSLLIGQAMGHNVFDIVSDGSAALVACAPNATPTVTANSHVDALVIAGNVVPIPGTQPPNTTIGSPQAQLIVLNEQFCPDPSAPAGTTTCTVNAAHIQTVSSGQVTDLKVSGATASVTSPNCLGGGGGCGPQLGNSQKTSQILQSDRTTPKDPQIPAVGDPIRFTVAAVNSAATSDSCTAAQQTGHNLRVIDRIPRGVTVDLASITVQTEDGTPVPTTGTVANCSATLEFGDGCSPEPSSDPTRDCLTVSAGDIAPQQTKKISFIATVNSTAVGGASPGCDSGGQGLGICNIALIQVDEAQNPSGTPRKNAIICPKPAAGDFLRTTGGGGCSLGATPHEGLRAGWPVALMGVMLVLRQWRRKRVARV
jgi:uncharacterized repeat protein (TIGR01451 family)